MDDYFFESRLLPNYDYVVSWIIPAILGTVAIVNSLINARHSKKQAERTANANMELAKFQNQANIEAVDKQNAYNTPAMQMARFGDAGLNPHLIYGQGSAGNQPAPVRAERAQVDYRSISPFQIPEFIGPYQDVQFKAAQIDNVKAATEATRTEIANKILGRMLTQANISTKEFDLSQKRVLAPYNADIRHGQAQSAYTKMLQEFQKLDGLKLQNMLRGEQIEKTGVESQKKRAELLFQQYRNEFMKIGITTSDNLILRMLVRSLGGLDIDVDTDKIQRDLHLK